MIPRGEVSGPVPCVIGALFPLKIHSVQIDAVSRPHRKHQSLVTVLKAKPGKPRIRARKVPNGDLLDRAIMPRCATSRCIVMTFTATGITRSADAQLNYSILIRSLN